MELLALPISIPGYRTFWVGELSWPEYGVRYKKPWKAYNKRTERAERNPYAFCIAATLCDRSRRFIYSPDEYPEAIEAFTNRALAVNLRVARLAWLLNDFDGITATEDEQRLIENHREKLQRKALNKRVKALEARVKLLELNFVRPE